MAEGLGLAAGIGGIVSLSITVFQGCVKGIQLISAAQHFGADADRLRSILEWEQCRLLSWGERAGLAGEKTRPSQQLNWTLIYELLKQLDSLLNDAETLKSRYNLDTDVGQDSPVPTQDANSRKSKSLIRVWSHVRPNIINARAAIIQDTTPMPKRLRWVALDQAKMKELLGDIGYFNNCLYEMLASIDRDFIQAALSSLLRNIISRSTEPRDLDAVKAIIDPDALNDASSIDAAASIKQLHLCLAETQTPAGTGTPANGPARPKPKLAKLKLQWFSPYGIQDSNHRQAGIYEFPKRKVKSEVLLEWKKVEKAVEKKLERRIQELTSMMSSITDESFHTLKCLGYLKKENEELSYNEFAYVFEIADLNSVAEKGHPASCLSTLSISLAADGRKPTLSHRVRYAKALAETVLQLHTSGWLHKAITPENVLFMASNEFVSGNREPGAGPDGSSSGPYLAGYEFSRADNPLEMTEDVPSSPYLALYRHPDAQGPARDSFCKAFDLYALGCLLLELALWKPLPVILTTMEMKMNPSQETKPPAHTGDNKQKHHETQLALKSKERISGAQSIKPLLEKVAFCAGDLFADAIGLCFHPRVTERVTGGGDEDEDDDDPELSIQTQLEIVDKLTQIKC